MKGFLDIGQGIAKAIDKAVEFKDILITLGLIVGSKTFFNTFGSGINNIITKFATLSQSAQNVSRVLGNMANAPAINNSQLPGLIARMQRFPLTLEDSIKVINKLRMNQNQAAQVLMASMAGLTQAQADQVARQVILERQTRRTTSGMTRFRQSLARVGVAMTGVGTAIKGMLTSWSFWLSLLPLLIPLIIRLGDALVTTHDEAVEAFTNATEEVSNTSSELSDLQSQLTETNDKINEIQSKGEITITDKNDLARLKQQNQLLQSQIKLKQQSLELEQKEAVKTGWEEIDADNYKAEDIVTFSDSKGTGPVSNLAVSSIGDKKNLSLVEALTELNDGYKTTKERLNQYISEMGERDDLTEAQLEVYNEKVKEFQGYLDSYQSQASDYLNDAYDVFDTVFEYGGTEDINKATEIQHQLRDALGDMEIEVPVVPTLAFAESINQDLMDFSSQMEEFGIDDIEIPVSFPKDILGSDELTKDFKDLESQLSSGKISLDEYYDALLDVNNAFDTISFNDIKSQISSLNSELSDGTIETDDYINDLVDTIGKVNFSQIGEEGTQMGEALQATLSSVTSGVQGAFNNIIDSYKSGEGTMLDFGSKVADSMDGIQDLADKFDSIKTDDIFDGALDGLDGLIDELDSASENLDAFEGYIQGLADNADYLRAHFDDMGNVMFTQANVMEKGYQNMITVAYNALQSVKQTTTGLSGQVQQALAAQNSQYANVLNMSQSQFQQACINDANLMNAVISVLSNQTGIAIQNAVNAGSNLLNTLANAISNFEAKISFSTSGTQELGRIEAGPISFPIMGPTSLDIKGSASFGTVVGNGYSTKYGAAGAAMMAKDIGLASVGNVSAINSFKENIKPVTDVQVAVKDFTDAINNVVNSYTTQDLLSKYTTPGGGVKNDDGGSGGSGLGSGYTPSGGSGSGGGGSGDGGGSGGGGGSDDGDSGSDEEEDVLEEYNLKLEELSHQIGLLDHHRDTVETGTKDWMTDIAKAIEYQEQIKILAHEQAEELRALPDGAALYAEEIRQLSDDWWEAEEAIRDYKEELIDATYEHKKALLEFKMAVSEANLAGMYEGRADYVLKLKEQIALTKDLQEIEEERIKQYQSLNASLYIEEILDAGEEWLDLQQDILDLTNDIKDAYEGVPDLVENIIQFEKIDPLEAQKDYLENYQDFIDQEYDIRVNFREADNAGNDELAAQYQRQLDYIAEVKLALQGINDADERNRYLKEAQLKLQEMNVDALKAELTLLRGERTKRVYHADKGWVKYSPYI